MYEEGDIITFANSEGIFIDSEIVKVICPYCIEEFIGSKKHSGEFLAGHEYYHLHINDRVDSMGGI